MARVGAWARFVGNKNVDGVQVRMPVHLLYICTCASQHKACCLLKTAEPYHDMGRALPLATDGEGMERLEAMSMQEVLRMGGL